MTIVFANAEKRRKFVILPCMLEDMSFLPRLRKEFPEMIEIWAETSENYDPEIHGDIHF